MVISSHVYRVYTEKEAKWYIATSSENVASGLFVERVAKFS